MDSCYYRLLFPNGEITETHVFNKIDLNNCLKSN